jgi:hypothetical protein
MSPPTSVFCNVLARVTPFVLALCAGCGPSARSGNGAVFSIRGQMVANSCGLNAPSALPTLSFDVELRERDGLVRWVIPSSGIFATGALDPRTRAFRFVDDRVLVLRPEDRRRGLAACAVRRLDVIDGRLSGTLPALDAAPDAQGQGMAIPLDAMAPGDASLRDDAGADGGTDGGAGWPALEGVVETVGWAVVQGADCRDALGLSAGQFIALPCEQRWTMDARWRPEVSPSR